MTNISPRSVLRDRNGVFYDLPIFLPVYHPAESPVPIARWIPDFGIRGCIVNAFFLYKDRDARNRLVNDCSLGGHIGFEKLIMTDSGAFQGFRGSLYLKNKTIVAFQEKIGSDIVSPLDLVSPPGEKRSVAEKKLNRTLIRIREARDVVSEGVLAGVQQGGRFHDLRQKSTDALLEMGIRYVALGSLVPFFNKNHDFTFIGRVISDARKSCGPHMPIHVYGAGDPVELPFMFAMGANVFDSSSYGHYALQGWYMTPYGALRKEDFLAGKEFVCSCPCCARHDPLESIFENVADLAAHNLYTIVKTLEKMRMHHKNNDLETMLEEILRNHAAWFPQSALGSSVAGILERG